MQKDMSNGSRRDELQQNPIALQASNHCHIHNSAVLPLM